MKKLILSLVAIATISLSSFGQAPEGFKYQAVVRDAGNTILNNQAVGMQIEILQGGISGTPVYTESFTPTTNTYGLVNLEIGTGTTSDDFTIIDWANDTYFIRTSIDVTGGSSYSVMGTSQLMSVPYALYAKTSGNGAGPIGPQGPAGADGIDGAIGATGPQGPAGNDGAVGATGPQGPAGNDGAVGATGATGPQGPAGADGTNGTNGVDGLSAYEVWLGLGNVGTEADFINSLTGPQGPAGNDGATGPQGPQGIQGPAGNDGAVGATGPQGPAGADGQGGVTTAGTNVTITGTGTVGDPYVVNAASGTCGLSIGDTYAGGIIFFLDGSGCHGLVAKATDEPGTYQWSSTYFNTWAFASGIYGGAQNTKKSIARAVASASTCPAASVCDNLTSGGYTDWYLPSKDELDMMYVNLHMQGLGGFAINRYYWSSTEHDSGFAWLQDFLTGTQLKILYPKNSTEYVRAVRAF